MEKRISPRVLRPRPLQLPLPGSSSDWLVGLAGSARREGVERFQLSGSELAAACARVVLVLAHWAWPRGVLAWRGYPPGPAWTRFLVRLLGEPSVALDLGVVRRPSAASG